MQDEFQKAQGHFKLDEFDEAVSVLEAIHEREGARPETLHLLAICFHRLGRDSDALPLLTELTTHHPQREDLWYYLGMSQKRLGQFEPAMRAFERLSELRAKPGRKPASQPPKPTVDAPTAHAKRPADPGVPTSFTEIILAHPGPHSAAIARLIVETTLDRRAMLTAYLLEFFLIVAVYLFGPLFFLGAALQSGEPDDPLSFLVFALVFGVPIAALVGLAVLQVKSRRYIVRDGYVRVRTGFILRSEENIELYKVTDVSLRTTLTSFLTGSGEIRLHTPSGTTKLRGITRSSPRLHDLVDKFRLLVALLRTTALTKGLIQ